MTRLDRLEERGLPVQMPAVAPFEYIWDACLAMGLSTESGMGEAPHDWMSIDAFVRLSRLVDEWWEIELLHQMSRAYLIAKQAGKDPLAIPPVEQDPPDV
jgi:hypothetical protein